MPRKIAVARREGDRTRRESQDGGRRMKLTCVIIRCERCLSAPLAVEISEVVGKRMPRRGERGKRKEKKEIIEGTATQTEKDSEGKDWKGVRTKDIIQQKPRRN